MTVCNFCVMDETDPDISFDDGRCNHCSDAEQKLAALGDEQARLQRMEQRIESIKQRNRSKPYDVIMGVSGGVDSSYALVKAKALGLRILAVHCDVGWNSDIAVSNIKNLVDGLDIDLETVVVDWNIMRSLQRSFFKASVSNCDIPQDHAIVAVNNVVANKMGVRDFISGGNLAGESIMPSSWGYDARDLRHIRDINSKYDRASLRKFPKMNFLESYFYFPFIKGVRNYRILNDIGYNPLEAKELLIKEHGWRDYGGKHHESVFTRFYQAYYLPTKFGYDKRKGHYSSLIAAGMMTRKEALELLDKPLYDPQLLSRDSKFFQEKLGFSANDWAEIMACEPVPHENFATNRQFHRLLTLLKEGIEKRGVRVRRSW